MALADPDQPEEMKSVAPNGQPWSHVTISRDIAHIKQFWEHENLRSLVEYKHRRLLTLDELLLTALSKPGVAWAAEARQLIAQQARLLGTDSDQTRGMNW